ncbi:hypothetical protein [Streptomyces lancefieldiae]|uniref:Integral membrane protein n=1 Tax=Streptomyces lancefieldiae TaxID=3075520 RepID=A0ABU3AG59_9ACTN|nr:hypothetical protein [Streptomyces sp. DSM 40712]MDT0609158.1 hypothetical protein [Streptomyces sp. DSM 40712]
MGKVVAGAVAVGVVVGALVLAHAVGAPLGTVLGAAAGVLALLWLLVLLTVPWNLYFRAHSVLAEITLSREKGLIVSSVRDTEASRIARIMLRTAVAGHVVTAGTVLAVAAATDERLGYWLAGLFLLSTAFRPAGAWFGQVRGRLGTLLRDVTYPRDDVAELKAEVARAVRGAEVLQGKSEEQYQALAELRRTMDALTASVYARADEADRKIVALGREFEATVNRLTTNEEIISGVKAFLRLMRSEDLGAPAAPPR